MEYKENFNNEITKLIRKRVSTRNYMDEKIGEDLKRDILNFIDNIESPFSSIVRFKWIDTDETKDIKLGTYGFIRGASSYIGVAVKKGVLDLEQLGYEVEKVVLYATKLGLGTCWLGGTFNRGNFSKIMEIDEDEIFPIVISIGYPQEKGTFIDKTIKRMVKSKSRKPWNELFYLRDLSVPLTEFNNLQEVKNILENVRLSPSASNKQPWRIIKLEQSYHFYLSHSKGYSNKLGHDIQRIDMGISLCHFHLSCKEKNIKGKFRVDNPQIKNVNKDIEYIISWISK